MYHRLYNEKTLFFLYLENFNFEAFYTKQNKRNMIYLIMFFLFSSLLVLSLFVYIYHGTVFAAAMVIPSFYFFTLLLSVRVFKRIKALNRFKTLFAYQMQFKPKLNFGKNYISWIANGQKFSLKFQNDFDAILNDNEKIITVFFKEDGKFTKMIYYDLEGNELLYLNLVHGELIYKNSYQQLDNINPSAFYQRSKEKLYITYETSLKVIDLQEMTSKCIAFPDHLITQSVFQISDYCVILKFLNKNHQYFDQVIECYAVNLTTSQLKFIFAYHNNHIK